MNAQKTGITLPDPDDFRAWLLRAMPAAGVSAARMARDLGLHRNTLGEFVARDGRGIGLGTASAVAGYLTAAAEAAGKELPPLGVACDA